MNSDVVLADGGYLRGEPAACLPQGRSRTVCLRHPQSARPRALASRAGGKQSAPNFSAINPPPERQRFLGGFRR
ncbi:hypothetical protein [Kibdelosporangium philippinense]|uniref:hypothetical protein n=1 Tax=Kibdelosporangium philippinense TaxID=211113 RepID=UPI003622C7FC